MKDLTSAEAIYSWIVGQAEPYTTVTFDEEAAAKFARAMRIAEAYDRVAAELDANCSDLETAQDVIGVLTAAAEGGDE